MNDGVPVYVRVQRDLMELLKAGEYKPGSKIPSERELSERFGASRMTTRKAIDKLVEEGALERRGTSGTYLPTKLLARTLSQDTAFGFSEMAHEHGRTSGSELLFFERHKADEETAELLGLSEGDPVIEICRQRTIDDVPVCIELSKIPARLVPGLSAADVVQNTSLYQLFLERYSVKLRRGDARLSVGSLNEEEAELLGLPPGSPVLDYQSIVFLEDGSPFEFVRSINHPQLVAFKISGLGRGGEDRSGARESVNFALVDES